MFENENFVDSQTTLKLAKLWLKKLYVYGTHARVYVCVFIYTCVCVYIYMRVYSVSMCTCMCAVCLLVYGSS